MSKPTIEIITSAKDSSFQMKKFDKRCFSAPFHFHPEIELTCILQGKGKRFIGNNMSGFEEDDLVLIGPQLPHCWKLTPTEKPKGGSLVFHFNPDFLGDGFFSLPEMNSIKNLLSRSEGGIQFNGKIKERIRNYMHLAFIEKSPFKKAIMLLEILNELAVSKRYALLNKKKPVASHSDNHQQRLNKVFAYIVENFHEEVLLDKAAKTIGLTPNAFCKYFKKITRKTFMETVIDYRINYANQLLIETEKSISDVCFESGFRDISHFYKKFSSRMGISPLNYRKQFFGETSNEN